MQKNKCKHYIEEYRACRQPDGSLGECVEPELLTMLSCCKSKNFILSAALIVTFFMLLTFYIIR